MTLLSFSRTLGRAFGGGELGAFHDDELSGQRVIISGCFSGDDLELAGQQHEVYSAALKIIIDGCGLHLRNSAVITGIDPGVADWLDGLAIDHRTLQEAHDLLAAAWRFRTSPPEPTFPAKSIEPPPTMDRWLWWLRQTVSEWNDRPEIVRAILTIAATQNTELGHLAEEELTTLLRESHGNIPWFESSFAARKGTG